tara:strand:- start:70 stop:276 length:207 start_codon:yes stop_codon:yes gene_type:complete
MKDNNQDRLNRIESKYSFQEDSIERMSQELRNQQLEIQKLKEEIVSLKESLIEISSKEDVQDEKPPHY